MATKVEWAKNPDGTKGESLNIVTGCSKVSPGCKNCYAERMAKRLKAMGQPIYDGATDSSGWTGHIGFVEERLSVPNKWRKPRTIFLNSMSDTFHEGVGDGQVGLMLFMAEQNQKHTFIVATKRAKRAKEILDAFCSTRNDEPIPNLWLLVSVENQKTADERIPHLLETNVAVRGLSMEPLLGEVDLGFPDEVERSVGLFVDKLHWVIVGGESGPGARAMHPDWARSIRDQCLDARVPFFFKQWGAWVSHGQVEDSEFRNELVCENKYKFKNVRKNGIPWNTLHRVGKKKAGRVLDGRTWDEMPDVMRDE